MTDVMVLVGDIIEKGLEIPYGATEVRDSTGVGWERVGVFPTWRAGSLTYVGSALIERRGPLVVTAVRHPEPASVQPTRRLRSCVEAWPEAESGAYDPRCCRFPKSCSATVYDEDRVTEEDLEPTDVVHYRIPGDASPLTLCGLDVWADDTSVTERAGSSNCTVCREAAGEDKVEPACGSCGGTGLVHAGGANGNWTTERCGCDAELTSDAVCHRCGGPNVVWAAPSPLWNVVMRGGSIGGQDKHDGIVCPTCFVVLAEEEDLAGRWRLYAESVTPDLEMVTPDGRVWDDKVWLWVDAGERHPESPDPCHVFHPDRNMYCTFHDGYEVCGRPAGSIYHLDNDATPTFHVDEIFPTDAEDGAYSTGFTNGRDSMAAELAAQAAPSVLLDLVRQYGDEFARAAKVANEPGGQTAFEERRASADVLFERIAALVPQQDRHEPHVDGPREPTEQERADHDLMSALGVERLEQVLPEIARLKELIGEEEAEAWEWKGVSRSEAIRQANEFHARAQTWLSRLDTVKADRETIRGSLQHLKDTVTRPALQLLGVEHNEDIVPAIERLKAAQSDPSVLSLPQVPPGTVALIDRDGRRWLPIMGNWEAPSGGIKDFARVLGQHGPLSVVMREPRTWKPVDDRPADIACVELLVDGDPRRIFTAAVYPGLGLRWNEAGGRGADLLSWATLRSLGVLREVFEDKSDGAS